jgi:hypothetical protein
MKYQLKNSFDFSNQIINYMATEFTTKKSRAIGWALMVVTVLFFLFYWIWVVAQADKIHERYLETGTVTGWLSHFGIALIYGLIAGAFFGTVSHLACVFLFHWWTKWGPVAEFDWYDVFGHNGYRFWTAASAVLFAVVTLFARGDI